MSVSAVFRSGAYSRVDQSRVPFSAGRVLNTRPRFAPCYVQAPGLKDKIGAALPDEVSKKIPTEGDRLPAQKQDAQPGIEDLMDPAPIYMRDDYIGTGKLKDQVAIITGGDSGIGRAVAAHFAREGADIVFLYLDEREKVDADKTIQIVEKEGRKAVAMRGDVAEVSVCKALVDLTLKTFGKIDILVNNAGEQHRIPDLNDVPEESIVRTFKTNIFGYFFMVKAVLPHLKEGARIINTASVVAYMGEPNMLDYAASKGAVLAFNKSLAAQLVSKGIRVNAVAPGPIWTPVNVATLPKENVGSELQTLMPMQRVGQPEEVATSYVFLAAKDSSFWTGQVMHPNGGCNAV